MQNEATIPMLALLGFGIDEIILIAAFCLIFPGRKYLPNLLHGLRRGFREFRQAVLDILDRPAVDAGKSLGGIYGKPAAQALTPDNRVAELYNPAVFEKEKNSSRLGKALLFRFTSFLRSTINFWRKILRRHHGV